MHSWGLEELLEKGTATHSSILAWRIPWTQEPGGSPWDHRESDTTQRLTLSLSSDLYFFFLNVLLYFVYLATWHGNHNSPTRDGTHTPCIGNAKS